MKLANLPLSVTDPRVHRVIKDRAETIKGFFFIQIGSNDGRTGDPIHAYVTRYRWSGLLIEPVPFLFKRLTETYAGHEGLRFENVAIADTDGYKPFYRTEEKRSSGDPWFYDQLGSFKKEVIAKHRDRIPNFEERLVTEQVPCLSFSTLLQKHQVTKIDLLHIDTEGYDYEILKLVPFHELKPAMILYEDKHLNEADAREAVALLHNQGYATIKMHKDMFAYSDPA